MWKVPPLIVPFTFGDEPTNFGDSVGIQCTVTKGDLPINIEWTLNGQLIDSVRATELGIVIGRMSSKSGSLNVDYVNGEHRGLIACRATNPAGTSEFAAELLVNGITQYGFLTHTQYALYFYVDPLRPVPPTIIPFAYDDIAHEGEPIDLICQIARGDRPVQIRWNFAGFFATPGVRIQANRVSDKSSLLSIPAASSEHSGTYTCTATNRAGSVSYATNVTVNGNGRRFFR